MFSDGNYLNSSSISDENCDKKNGQRRMEMRSFEREEGINGRNSKNKTEKKETKEKKRLFLLHPNK